MKIEHIPCKAARLLYTNIFHSLFHVFQSRSAKKIWIYIGPLRLHLLAFKAPQSKRWSSICRVCQTCCAAHEIQMLLVRQYWLPCLDTTCTYTLWWKLLLINLIFILATYFAQNSAGKLIKAW